MASQLAQHEIGDHATFDPTGWLAALVAIGGGYALASGRKLWFVVQDCGEDELTTVMSHIVGKPDRVEALRWTIERRQAGEVL